MAETRPVKGYEGLYLVTEEGEIISLPRVVFNGRGYYERPMQKLKAGIRSGYKFVILRKDSKDKTLSVHRIVAEAFIDNPNGYEQVNHKDENPLNNTVENLEWCTKQYNLEYSKSHPVAQLDKGGTKIAEYKSIVYASRITGISASTISNVINGHAKTAGGYYWISIERSNER